jgi:hypothetical protein
MPSAQIHFQDALTAYQSLPALDIDTKIVNLDRAINTYHTTTTDANKTAVQSAFAPIATYYATLNDINKNLRTYLNKVSSTIADSQDTLINEDRLNERVHPEETIAAREIAYGIFPKFRLTSLPYILTAGVFLSLFSIFLIFQMLGFTGQFNLPQSLVQQFSSPAGVASVPFYKNPLILGGVVAALASALVIFVILYYKEKNTNKP